MAPTNTNSKKRKATTTPSSAQRGGAGKMSSKMPKVHSHNTEAGVDRISSLPNCIMGCILTLLSISDAVRMTKVSTNWKEVFSSPDYKLDYIDDSEMWCAQRHPCDSSMKLEQMCSDAITSLLKVYHRYIRRFIIQRILPSDAVMSRWLYILSKTGVIEELVLKMPLPYPSGLSHYIFKCSSLRSLSLFNCRWPGSTSLSINLPAEWTLPQVTELTLSHMFMTVDDVQDLLARCPALLSLSLIYPRHPGFLDIKCKNLLSLTRVGCGGSGWQVANAWQYLIRIVDAPKLERMLWWPHAPPLTAFLTKMIGQTPRLHTLGIFQDCPFIENHGGVMLEHVRTIALHTNVDNLLYLKHTIITLHHLPQLETLHLKMMDGSKSDNSESKLIRFEELVGGPIHCLENNVKRIVLRVNNLVRKKLAFTNFLLGATKSLKSMVIYSKRMTGELLPPERRGSSSVEVKFGDNSECTIPFDTSASNYKLADPFMT